MKKQIETRLTELCGKPLAHATDRDLYRALLRLTQELSDE